MGRKLDALLGRGFKTSKLKATLNLAIYRLSVLKNQRHARCSVARSDVVEFLNLGHHDRALLRMSGPTGAVCYSNSLVPVEQSLLFLYQHKAVVTVEQVIKEQNMLDVFTMIEGYCHLLIERINLIGQEKECPDELKEAASNLIYATTRCGEFPELQEIRAIFTSRFGKEFAARAIELRNNCGVNPQIIQKLSTRMPSLEQKTKVVEEIAAEYNIPLQIEETPLMELQDSGKDNQTEDIERVGYLSDSVKMRKKYKDVADAAQAAFESAAYAAEAARAAVELSRSRSTDPDHPSNPSDNFDSVKSKLQTDDETQVELKFELTQNDESSRMEQFKQQNEKQTQFSRSPSNSSLDSEDGDAKEANVSLVDMRQSQPTESEMVFDESDDESVTPFSKDYKDEMPVGSSKNPHHSSQRLNIADEINAQSVEHLNIKRNPISVRTKRTYGR